MAWTDSGINWVNPGPNIPMWTCFVELSKAINERHHLTGRQRFDIVDKPLIAFLEEDDYANANVSRGTRQYKMYQYLNTPFEAFKSMSRFGPVTGIYNAIANELRWNYSRTDLTSYIVDENNPRTRNELTNFGFPQAWDHAPISSTSVADDVAFIEATVPACNSIWTRIDNDDPSLYDSAGFAKREIITELFELLKAFKFVNHFYGKSLGSLIDINEYRGKQVVNEPLATFQAAWTSAPDNQIGPPSLQINYINSSKVSGSCYNADLVTDWGSFGLSTPPSFVTPPRQRLSSDVDGKPTEAVADGFYDMPFTSSGGLVTVNQWVTLDGETPVHLTIPAEGDNHITRSVPVASGGSNLSQNGMVYDLTSVSDLLNYPADGS